jgi:inner membrane protein involved in colicin E2 resistance
MKTILIAEDGLAIADSIVLPLAVLAAMMVATRKVDWCQVGKPAPEASAMNR